MPPAQPARGVSSQAPEPSIDAVRRTGGYDRVALDTVCEKSKYLFLDCPRRNGRCE